MTAYTVICNSHKVILSITLPVRLRAQWQLNGSGDETVAVGGTVNVRALQLNSCLYWQLGFFQYRMDFTETACVVSSA